MKSDKIIPLRDISGQCAGDGYALLLTVDEDIPYRLLYVNEEDRSYRDNVNIALLARNNGIDPDFFHGDGYFGKVLTGVFHAMTKMF